MKNLSKNPQELSFKITSGKLNITDPCYDVETSCALFNLPAENGQWLTFTEYEYSGSWGYLVKTLIARRPKTYIEYG